MTPRQRYLETLLFGKPDRIPLDPGAGRKSTRERWHREGLPGEFGAPDAINEHAYRLSGGKLPWPKAGEDFPLAHGMIPQFEEKVLERKGDTQIVQDWKGNICEIGLEFDPSYLRTAIDLVTRRWIKCPVENRDDWEAMKLRYNPDDPGRLPPETAAFGARLANRTCPLLMWFSGPFWQLREWLGFELLCETFINDPDWIREMVLFWQEYIARLLENAFKYVTPDHVHFSEDMAYKAHPMISPAMTREFLLPCYKRWGELLRQHNVPVYGIDSDGDVATLISVWIDAGVKVIDPMEVAAGIDLPALRAVYGKRMAFRCGVDKRCIAAGGQKIVDEVDRLKGVIKTGGFIPACDHGVPSDVSWQNYVRFVGLVARATGWL